MCNTNLVPLRATSSESVPVMELYNMYNSEDINKSFAITYISLIERSVTCRILIKDNLKRYIM